MKRYFWLCAALAARMAFAADAALANDNGYYYTGGEIRPPAAPAADGGRSIAYLNNINAGTASLSVRDNGSPIYERQFAILPYQIDLWKPIIANLSDSDFVYVLSDRLTDSNIFRVSIAQDVYYAGKAAEPALVITHNGIPLRRAPAPMTPSQVRQSPLPIYFAEYRNNNSAGRAVLILTLPQNFNGRELRFAFDIIPLLSVEAPNFGRIERGAQPSGAVVVRNNSNAALPISFANLRELKAKFAWQGNPPSRIEPYSALMWEISPRPLLQPNQKGHNTPVQVRASYLGGKADFADTIRIAVNNTPPLTLTAIDQSVTFEYNTDILPQARLIIKNRHSAAIAYSVRVSPAHLFDVQAQTPMAAAGGEVLCIVQPKSADMPVGASHWAVVSVLYAGGYAAVDTVRFAAILPSRHCNAGIKASMTPAEWEYGSPAGAPAIVPENKTPVLPYKYAHRDGEPMLPPSQATPAGQYLVKTSIAADGGCPAVEVQGTFQILPRSVALRGIRIDSIAPQVFANRPLTPALKVYDGQTLLQADEDYQASYHNNTDAGTARISIKGIHNYTGERSFFFAIQPYTFPAGRAAGMARSSSAPSRTGAGGALHSLSDSAYVYPMNTGSGANVLRIEQLLPIYYNGQPKEPLLNVTYNGGIVQCVTPSDPGYDSITCPIKYQNNIEKGTASITINVGPNFAAPDRIHNLSFKILPPIAVPDTLALQPIGFPQVPEGTSETKTLWVNNKTNREIEATLLISPDSLFDLPSTYSPSSPYTIPAAAPNSQLLALKVRSTLPAGDYKAWVSLFFLDSMSITDTVDIHIIRGAGDSVIIGFSDASTMSDEFGSGIQRPLTVTNPSNSFVRVELSLQDPVNFELVGYPSFFEIPANGVDSSVKIRIKQSASANVSYRSRVYAIVGGAVKDSAEIFASLYTYDIAPTGRCDFLDIAPQPYTGSPIEPPLVITCNLSGGGTAVLGSADINLSYQNNTVPTTAASPAAVIITGKNNYHGGISAEFQIVKRQVDTTMLNFHIPGSVTNDGQEHRVGVTPKVAGIGDIVVKYEKLSGSLWIPVNSPIGTGNYRVSVDVANGDLYEGINGLILGEFSIVDPNNQQPQSGIVVWDTSLVHIDVANTIFLLDKDWFEKVGHPDKQGIIKVEWQMYGYMPRAINHPCPCMRDNRTCEWLVAHVGSYYIPNNRYCEQDTVWYRLRIQTQRYNSNNVALGIPRPPLVSTEKAVGFRADIPRATPMAAALRAYPSVADKNQPIKVEVDKEHIGLDIEVYSTMGQLIFRQTIKDLSTDIYINESPGAYFIKVNGLQTKVLIK